MTTYTSEDKEVIIREIARKHLCITTLDVRNIDSLDFYNCSVESIRSALEAAYNAGLQK